MLDFAHSNHPPARKVLDEAKLGQKHKTKRQALSDLTDRHKIRGKRRNTKNMFKIKGIRQFDSTNVSDMSRFTIR